MSLPESEVRLDKPATSFVVEHRVPAASKTLFLEMEKLLEAAALKAGCTECRLEELPGGRSNTLHFRTTMEFGSTDLLVAWVDSKARLDLLQTARQQFKYGYALKTSVHAFEGWFPVEGRKPPAAWKQCLLVLLTLYPTVLVTQVLLHPLTDGLHLATSMLIGNALTVSITGFLLIPLANRWFSPWLRAPVSPRARLLAPLIVALLLLGFLLLGWALIQ